jgi:hypothetical protein
MRKPLPFRHNFHSPEEYPFFTDLPVCLSGIPRNKTDARMMRNFAIYRLLESAIYSIITVAMSVCLRSPGIIPKMTYLQLTLVCRRNVLLSSINEYPDPLYLASDSFILGCWKWPPQFLALRGTERILSINTPIPVTIGNSSINRTWSRNRIGGRTHLVPRFISI